MSDGMRDSSNGLSAYLFGTHGHIREADATGTELTRLLDRFKHQSQMAGQTHQRAQFGMTEKDNTGAWLDDAEKTRTAIIEHVNELKRIAHDAGMRHV